MCARSAGPAYSGTVNSLLLAKEAQEVVDGPASARARHSAALAEGSGAAGGSGSGSPRA